MARRARRAPALVKGLARRLDQSREVPAVPGPRFGGLPGCLQLLERESAHEHEQLEAAVIGLAADQAGFEQLFELRRAPVADDRLQRRPA